MATASPPVSDMLLTVKSREIQRGMLAEMRGDVDAVRRHFLAAAHLELVLAEDYEQAGEPELAFRSQLSAASCFWTGGHVDEARAMLDELSRNYPDRRDDVQEVLTDLAARVAG